MRQSRPDVIRQSRPVYGLVLRSKPVKPLKVFHLLTSDAKVSERLVARAAMDPFGRRAKGYQPAHQMEERN